MRQYHELLQTIKDHGSYKEPAREGMPGSLSLFGHQNRYDLSQGFPILTTKKMFWKGIVVELLWFLRGDTNIKYLDEHDVTKLWHQDAYNYYVINFKDRSIYGTTQDIIAEQEATPYTFEDFCKVIRDSKREFLPRFHTNSRGEYVFGDCGFQYGKVWRAWETGKWMTTGHTGTHNVNAMVIVDQIARVVRSIQNGPYGRRHIVTAWDPAHEQDLALTWCHALFQFNCRKVGYIDRAINWETQWGRPLAPDDQSDEFLDQQDIPKYYLDCQLYQRSCDAWLGVPFNISSYALLTHIVAKICNMVPGEFVHTFGDVHIYDNHKEEVDEILNRFYAKYKLPSLKIADEGNDWAYIGNTLDFSMLEYKDFQLLNYESYPAMKGELSTGMKKQL